MEKLTTLSDNSPRPDGDHVMVRIAPRGATHDTYEELRWVPSALRSAGAQPENLRTFAAPWLHKVCQGSLAHGPGVMALWGAGGFLVGLSGSALVCCFPVERMLDLGGTVDAGFRTVCSMEQAELEAFLAKACFAAVLQPERAVWAPFGWYCSVLPLLDTPSCDFLHPLLGAAAAEDSALQHGPRRCYLEFGPLGTRPG